MLLTWRGLKHSPNVIVNVHLISFVLHQIDELEKVNGATAVDVDLHDGVVELLLAGVLAHGPQHVQQLLGGDGAATVLAQLHGGLDFVVARRT